MEQRDNSLEGDDLASGRSSCSPPLPKKPVCCRYSCNKSTIIFATGKARITLVGYFNTTRLKMR